MSDNAATSTQLLIIGAGPFGLAAAARAKARGLDHCVVGRPLSFWKEHMPKGMYLRSGFDWHMDPQNERTFERFLTETHLERAEPISLTQFLEYGKWFQRECGIDVNDHRVVRVERHDGTNGFTAHLDHGGAIHASAVFCAPGFWPFRNVPVELTRALPPERVHHSAGISDVDRFSSRRCLIVGGRQSAFETGVLLAEHGAASVTIVHRHPTPAFARSDWSFVAADMRTAEAAPGWFADLTPDQRRAIERHFWEEGRLKLEPWLGDRLRKTDVAVIQNSTVERLEFTPDGAVRATLCGDHATTLDVDDVIFATGFKVDLARIDYLQPVLSDVESDDGYPLLTPQFESRSVPGLFLAGLAAARQFGPYMGFLASCPFTARTAVDAAAHRLGHGA